MNRNQRPVSSCFSLAAFLVIALSNASTALAGSPTNTMLGGNALGNIGSSAAFDTALGYFALGADTTGSNNTATGAGALEKTTSHDNTATGFDALALNGTGYENTAVGATALYNNRTGFDNTATGFNTLYYNTTGIYNTAVGFEALYNNNGDYNTATGYQALLKDTTGLANTATGFYALASDSSGDFNTAVGNQALGNNTTGGFNTGIGHSTLISNTTGKANIAIGDFAGFYLTTGNFNIDIGNQGVKAESETIRIGNDPPFEQTATYIAGINGTALIGSDVVINNRGRLGVVMSSARFKRDIRDMGERSSELMKLRPVTFRYKNDQTGTLQYGLVAEEVAKIYPELVTYSLDGKVETVRYSMLSAMLLNELQKLDGQLRKQARENQRQAGQIQRLSERSAQQAERIEQQAVQNQRLSAQVAEEKASRKRETEALRATFEGHLAALEHAIAKNDGRKLAAAFDR